VTRHAAATRYARALFDVALRESDVAKIGDELTGFVGLIQSHEVLATVFANPAIPGSRKAALVKALIERAGPLSAPLSKLILLLADRDRLVLLPDLASAYRERLLDHQRVIRGNVTTAVALDEQKLRLLEQGLARATGRKVILESKVDPSIIGGVVTRLGSTVYDGSVTAQLNRLKESLIESGQ
jgi:F-type H+-transporting ATPase subunit delta